MINQKPGADQNEEPIMGGYRGTLSYLQGRGYKIITMIVSIRARNEQSCVICRAFGHSSMKDAEHIPVGPLPVDLYNFLVTDDTEITLTIKNPVGEQQARYIVRPDSVEQISDSPFWFDIIRSSKGIDR